jgi:hypothetical protein
MFREVDVDVACSGGSALRIGKGNNNNEQDKVWFNNDTPIGSIVHSSNHGTNDDG